MELLIGWIWSDPESVSTASDIAFETMHAVDSSTGSGAG